MRAESLGLHAAYTYDHLSWRSFRERPWFEAMTTLAAAAVATSTLRLGPLVTSPNFRHPVPLAKELLTLDDLSGGRLVVGIGSGGTGFDAGALGAAPWAAAERSARFREFTSLLDQLLTRAETTSVGSYYSAHDVVRHPAPITSPRPAFVVSALGPRAMDVAAEFGQGWVTTGVATGGAHPTTEAAVAGQVADLDAALDTRGRSGRRSSGSCSTASATSPPWRRSTPSSTWPVGTGPSASPSWSSTGPSRTRRSPPIRTCSSAS